MQFDREEETRGMEEMKVLSKESGGETFVAVFLDSPLLSFSREGV